MKLWPDVALIIVIIGMVFNTAAISFINRSINNLLGITKSLINSLETIHDIIQKLLR